VPDSGSTIATIVGRRCVLFGGAALLATWGILACADVVGLPGIRFETSAEAGDVPDAAAADASRSWCAINFPAAALCADFEGPSLAAVHAAGAPASFTVEASEAFVELDPLAHSDRRSLRVRVPRLIETGRQLPTFVSRQLPNLTALEVSFNVYLAEVERFAPAEGKTVQLGGLELGMGANVYKLHVGFKPPDGFDNAPIVLSEVYSGGTLYREKVATDTVKMKTWTRVTIEVRAFDARGDAGTATVFIESDVQAKIEAIQSGLLVDKPGPPVLRIGLLPVGPSGAWELRYDEVVVREIP
jgi:hypothetical protein